MKNYVLTDNSTLRQKAEEQLSNSSSSSDLDLSKFENYKFLQELQVHQLELEMQNDELLRAKERTDLISDKYIELYNFAPISYFTITKECEIVELNLCASQMIGKDLNFLINKRICSFFNDVDKIIFNKFIKDIFRNQTKETCKISISLDDDLTKEYLFTGIICRNCKNILVASIDITDQIKLEKKNSNLEQFNNYFVNRELKMCELKKEINNLLESAGSIKRY